MWTYADFMGGAQGLDISSDYTLPPPRTARVWVFDPQSAGLVVNLPDALRRPLGWNHYMLVNESGIHSLLVKDDGGTTLATLTPGDRAEVGLVDATTTDGKWIIRLATF